MFSAYFPYRPLSRTLSYTQDSSSDEDPVSIGEMIVDFSITIRARHIVLVRFGFGPRPFHGSSVWVFLMKCLILLSTQLFVYLH